MTSELLTRSGSTPKLISCTRSQFDIPMARKSHAFASCLIVL